MKTKVLPPRALMTLAEFGYPVQDFFMVLLPKTLVFFQKLFGFPIF
jgi:hypothetical protein